MLLNKDFLKNKEKPNSPAIIYFRNISLKTGLDRERVDLLYA